jgi:hypothetical protein
MNRPVVGRRSAILFVAPSTNERYKRVKAVTCSFKNAAVSQQYGMIPIEC